ncbi:MAG: hypothetical protein GY842_10770 [bacterium]|nr:hypothetical protein [bacterium]
MMELEYILAQGRDLDFSNLIYLVLVVLLPMLGGLGKWIRDRSAAKEEELEEIPDRPANVPAVPTRRSPPAARPTSAGRRPPPPVEVEGRPEVVMERVLDAAFPGRRKRAEAPEAAAGRTVAADPRHHDSRRPRPAPRARPVSQPPKTGSRSPRSRTRKRSPEEEIRAVKRQLKQSREVQEVADRHDLGSMSGLSVRDLRRAIVLREVLGPPLALRDAAETS